MNKRMKKKQQTKKPTTKERMRYYMDESQKLSLENRKLDRQNDELLERSAGFACEFLNLKRANKALANKNIQLAHENASLEKEINELLDDNRYARERSERMEGLIKLLEYRVSKYKEQLDMLQKPFWKKVIGK